MIVEHGCDDHSELDDSCDPQRLAFAQLSASIGERTQLLEKSRGGRGDGEQLSAAWLLPVRVKKGETLSLSQRYRVPAVESGEQGYGVSYLLRMEQAVGAHHDQSQHSGVQLSGRGAGGDRAQESTCGVAR
jgi:hypothetical protein